MTTGYINDSKEEYFMRLNKILMGICALAIAAGITIGIAPKASAANTVNAPDIAQYIGTYYSMHKLWIDRSSHNNKISVSFPTVNKEGKITEEKEIYTYDAAYEAMDGSWVYQDVDVDLSTLNPAKDNYVKVWGDRTKEPVIIKIPAAERIGKGIVHPEKCQVQLTRYKKSDIFDGYAEFAVGADMYTDITFTEYGLIKPTYFVLGTTLRARVQGGSRDPQALKGVTPKLYDINKSTEKAKVFEMSETLPSKEVKIKVPRMAKAPKVSIDYAKGQIKLPKGAEYRINTDTDLGKWKDGDKAILSGTGDNKQFDMTKDTTIDVRIKATEKKPASIYRVVSMNAQAALTTIVTPSKSDSGLKTNDKFDASLKVGQVDQKLSISYVRKASVGKTATSGAITISNANKNYSFQYILVKGSACGKKPAVDAKGVKTIKPQAEKASGAVTATIKINNKDDYELYVRRAALSKGEISWATDWVKVAKLNKTQLDVAP